MASQHNQHKPCRLTVREFQILDGVKSYLANKEIGNKLNISERTVKFHVSSLLRKARVSGRAELVNWSPEEISDFGFYFLYKNLSNADKDIVQYVACGVEYPDIEKKLSLSNLNERMSYIGYALGLTEGKLGYTPNIREEITRWMNLCQLVTPTKSSESDELRRKVKGDKKLRVFSKTKEAV